MSEVQSLKRSHNSTLDKAAAYQELLLAANTTASITLAAKMREQRDAASVTVETATKAKQKARSLKKAFNQADLNLKATVQGTYAIIGATDPELRAKLPDPEAWSELTGGQQAEHLIDALKKAGGKEVKTFIQNLTAVSEVRRKAERAWLDVDTGTSPVNAGADELAKLKMLNAQADVLLREIAKPGSALYDLLKQAQGGKRKSKKSGASGDKKTPPANETKKETSGQQPAPSTTPAQHPAGSSAPAAGASAASAPASSGSSASSGVASPPTGTAAPLPDAQPAVNVVVPAGAPAVQNGVHV